MGHARAAVAGGFSDSRGGVEGVHARIMRHEQKENNLRDFFGTLRVVFPEWARFVPNPFSV